MMARPIPFVNRRPNETKSQRKRRNVLRLVYSVFPVGEQMTTDKLMRLMIESWGAGHHSLPKNTNALGQTLKGAKEFEKVKINRGYNEWRRRR